MEIPQKIALVTGASRGIGLQFSKDLVKRGYFVVATCRNPDKAKLLLEVVAAAKGKCVAIPMDVTDTKSITDAFHALFHHVCCCKVKNNNEEKAKCRCGSTVPFPYLSLLIHNAGISNDEHPVEEILFAKAAQMMKVYETNVVGPLLVTQVFWPALEKADCSKIVAISSRLGSLTENRAGGPYKGNCVSYRSSKAALNMMMKTLAMECSGNNRVFLCLTPGWVRTDMGGTGENGTRMADLTPEESVAGMLQVIEAAKPDEGVDGCQLLSYQGEVVPW